MTDTTDPDRYLDPEYRQRATKSAPLLGEPAATELRAALDTIEKQAKRIELLTSRSGGYSPSAETRPKNPVPPLAGTGVQHRSHNGVSAIEYAVDAIVTDLEAWFEDPDPADAYDKLCRVQRELRELVRP